MSIRVMSWVWENAKAEGAEMLVLLALADHAGDDGSCYPSMNRISTRARLSLRGAQTAVRSLEAKGLIATDINAGPKGCNRYRILTTPATSAPPRNICTPPQITASTPATSAPTPANGGIKPPQHLHPNRKEPSLEPSENHVTPEAIAKGALLLMRVSDFSGKLLLAMTEQVRFESAVRPIGEDLAEEMAAAWKKLQSSRPKLEHSWGAENFFGQGYWKDEATWPWKQGAAPQPKIVRKSLVDQVRQQKGESLAS